VALSGTISEVLVTELPVLMRLAAMASPRSATFLALWRFGEPCTGAPAATWLVTNPKRQRGFRRCWLVWHSGRRTNWHCRGRLPARRDSRDNGLWQSAEGAQPKGHILPAARGGFAAPNFGAGSRADDATETPAVGKHFVVARESSPGCDRPTGTVMSPTHRRSLPAIANDRPRMQNTQFS
jgi:hypothetical protein